jgi:hypothetical protein
VIVVSDVGLFRNPTHNWCPRPTIQDHVQQSPHSLSSSVLVPNSDRAPPARWKRARSEMRPSSCHCTPSVFSPASAFASQIHITRSLSRRRYDCRETTHFDGRTRKRHDIENLEARSEKESAFEAAGRELTVRWQRQNPVAQRSQEGAESDYIPAFQKSRSSTFARIAPRPGQSNIRILCSPLLLVLSVFISPIGKYSRYYPNFELIEHPARQPPSKLFCFASVRCIRR